VPPLAGAGGRFALAGIRPTFRVSSRCFMDNIVRLDTVTSHSMRRGNIL